MGDYYAKLKSILFLVTFNNYNMTSIGYQKVISHKSQIFQERQKSNGNNDFLILNYEESKRHMSQNSHFCAKSVAVWFTQCLLWLFDSIFGISPKLQKQNFTGETKI